MLVHFGNNTIGLEDTTMNKIEFCIGKANNTINPYKTEIIFCNNVKYYLGTDYLKYSCEQLPPVFSNDINNYKYVLIICHNSG